MKKFVNLLAGMSVCAFCLTGCGGAELPEQIDTTTLSVDKEGGITSYLIEDFAKDYYKVSELTTMAVKDAAAYNEAHQEGEKIPVTVESVELLNDGNRVMVRHHFLDDDAYEGYMEGTFFYGTVEEALNAGYDVSASLLSSVKDGTLVSDNWIAEEASDKHIVITDGRACIYCPYKVTHISNNAVYNTDGSVDGAGAAGTVFILMNK